MREALALLQIEGLDRLLPKRSSFVYTPNETTIADLCGHSAILEAACLKFAFERNADALIGGLRQGMDQMQRAIANSASAAYSQAHRAIVQSSDNKSMSRVCDATIGPLMASRKHLFTIVNGHLDRSMAEQQKLKSGRYAPTRQRD